MHGTEQKTQIDLSVEICGLRFKNPLVVSSGMLTAHERGMLQGVHGGAGGVSAKTVGPRPKKGHPQPQIVRPTAFYIINAQGIPNPGIDAYKEELVRVRDACREHDVRFLGSALGDSTEEILRVCHGLQESGVEMIELNVSCVHPTPGHRYGFFQGDSAEQVAQIVRRVKPEVDVPIVPKLSSHKILDVPMQAMAAQEAGADAVIVANTFPCLALNPETLRPALGNPDGVGGLSGPAVKPLVARMVADTARMISIPIIATGGSVNGQDVLEMLCLGASLVQVHSVIMMDKYTALGRMVHELTEALAGHGFTRATGAIRHSLQFMPAVPLQCHKE